MTARSMTPTELVQWGIACGLVHPKPAMLPVEKNNHASQRRFRLENRAKGLRCDGKPRILKSWPQLQGLMGKAYMREYTKLYRATHKRKDAKHHESETHEADNQSTRENVMASRGEGISQ